MTWLLLIAGGLVTSTDSGLSVPDWPLSYGTLFPPMVGGIAFEHSHRLIAAVVGLMITILAGWLWFKEPRRWVRYLGYGALVGVVTQAILGGLTVLWMLPAPISVAHACLGQTVFCLVVCIALVTAPTWQTYQSLGGDDAIRSARTLCVAITLLLSLQLVLGAVIRHSGNFLMPHIIGAIVVSMIAGRVVWHLSRAPRHNLMLIRIATGLAIGLALQLALGLLALGSRAYVVIPTAHMAVGSLVLANSCVLTLLACRVAGSPPVVRSRVVAQGLLS